MKIPKAILYKNPQNINGIMQKGVISFEEFVQKRKFFGVVFINQTYYVGRNR